MEKFGFFISQCVSRKCLSYGLVSALTIFPSVEVFAAESDWTGTTNSDWNTSTNWSAGIPTDVAGFNSGPAIVAITIASTPSSINSLTYNSGAPTYTISITSANLTIQGVGVVNNSGSSQSVTVNSGGVLAFTNSATAGNLQIQVSSGGTLNFSQLASASNATITNAGAINLSGMSQNIGFGTLTSTGTGITLGSSNLILGAGGTANSISDSITGSGSLLLNGGTLSLFGNTQVATTVNAGTLTIGSGATMSNSLLITDTATNVIAASGSTLTGTTTVNASGVYTVQTTNNIGTVNNAGSTTISVNPTATSFINTGDLLFTGAATTTAGITTLDNQTGGVIDISGISGSAFTVTNLVSPSNGDIDLGSKNLTLGNNAIINGVIADGGVSGGTGGQFTIAAGKAVTLNNNNTYTGLTTVLGTAGTVLNIGTITNANASIAGAAQVNANGALNIYGSIGSALTNAGTTTFLGTSTAAAAAITNSVGGSLVFNNSSSAGTSTITNAAALSFNNTSSAASATIHNAGTLTLSGMTTNLAIGSLDGAGGVTLTNAGLTTSLGGLNTTGTISGLIAGVGNLTKIGTGTLTLSNALNTYLGLTTVAQGTLNLTGHIAGNAQINSGAFLTGTGIIAGNAAINGTFNGPTVNGTSTVGSGGLVQSGTLVGLTTVNNGGIVQGTTTVTGGVTVNSGGVVQGNAVVTGATTTVNSGGLIQGNTTLSTTAINDAGTINGNGSSPLQITGVTTVLSGGLITGNTRLTSGSTTTIQSGGTFAGNTAITTGGVTINSGGTFQALGTIGGMLTNNGALSPGGNSGIGTLTTNSYQQGASGTYTVSLGTGVSDLLAVTGMATLGGTLDVNAHGDPAAINHLYTILTAGNPITTKFSSLQPLAFYTQEVFYNPHSVQYLLSYNQAALLNAANTPNERSVATSILVSNGTTAINNALATFSTEEQANTFLNELSGAIYASQQLALIQIGQQFTDQIADRLEAVSLCLGKEERYRYRYRKFDEKIQEDTCIRQTWWTNLYIGNDDFSGGESVSGLKANIFGVVVGTDKPVSDHTMLGAALGYGNFRDDTTDFITSSGNGDIFQLAMYGRYRIEDWKFGGAIGYAYANDISTTRNINTGVNVVQTSGDYKANVVFTQARMSYDFHVQERFDLIPQAGIIYQRLNTDNFHENSITGFELNIDNNNYRSLRTQIGVDVDIDWSYYSFQPVLMLAWEHEFDDEFGTFNASFVGTATQFPIQGASVGRNALFIQAGVMLAEQYNWDLSLLYEGRFADAFRENFLVVEVGFF